VLRVILVAIVVLLLLKLVVNRLEPSMVFFPMRGEDDTPARLGLRYHPIKLRASDGVQIAAWQLEPENATADIVYFHGNGGNLSMWLPVFATLHGFGYRVLAIDYRGYGLSEGAPTESGLLLDAEAVARHAASSRVEHRPLIYWGRSLGGPIAAAAAGFANPDALVLESTFPDKASIVRSMPLFLLLNVFSSYRLDTIGRLRGFTKPVLVVHGDGDTIIPYALGERLFERLDAPKRFVTVPGGDHNDFFDARHEAYWTPIRAFIDAL
jgi:fermentation-respiration switch protein FrsA (DUF1100 family)